MLSYLTLEDLADLVDVLGVGPVRDNGLLASAAERPQSTWQGVEIYPDIHTKAAALLDAIVSYHALLDGNKRLGWLATVVFYGLNGWTLDVADDPAYDLVIAIADGSRRDVADVAAELRAWTHPTA